MVSLPWQQIVCNYSYVKFFSCKKIFLYHVWKESPVSGQSNSHFFAVSQERDVRGCDFSLCIYESERLLRSRCKGHFTLKFHYIKFVTLQNYSQFCFQSFDKSSLETDFSVCRLWDIF